MKQTAQLNSKKFNGVEVRVRVASSGIVAQNAVQTERHIAIVKRELQGKELKSEMCAAKELAVHSM